MTHPTFPGLLVDLVDAEARARREIPCPLCEYLDALPAGEEREALKRAVDGTIGANTLVSIFQRHEIPVGRRTLQRHRKEGHGQS